MRAHVIIDGIVSNTIEVESLDFMPGLLDAALGGEIGDLWDGTVFSKAPRDNPVPEKITPLEARRALRVAGLLSAVNAWIATQPGDTQDAWEYCIEVRRDDRLVANAQDALGLTSEQVDDLFRAGAIAYLNTQEP